MSFLLRTNKSNSQGQDGRRFPPGSLAGGFRNEASTRFVRDAIPRGTVIPGESYQAGGMVMLQRPAKQQSQHAATTVQAGRTVISMEEGTWPCVYMQV
jgi:hypothetical protein